MGNKNSDQSTNALKEPLCEKDKEKTKRKGFKGYFQALRKSFGNLMDRIEHDAVASYSEEQREQRERYI
jgi:hypothetical protein